jgi:hypothetical protein
MDKEETDREETDVADSKRKKRFGYLAQNLAKKLLPALSQQWMKFMLTDLEYKKQG